MLLGCHPTSGRRLLHATGSAERARQLHKAEAPAPCTTRVEGHLSLPQAARQLGVGARYLRALAAETAAARAAEQRATPGAAPAPLDGPYLDAVQAGPGAHWRVSRAEVARFAAARKPPAAVIGYDLTFSVPKSVSILWAWAEPERQAQIVAAVHDAVAAGVAYLEDHATFVRTGPGYRPQPATGLLAASYLHATSRALDPQLHAHVVVANMAESPEGSVRALDARALFVHATTASHLAAAELRHQLSRRLGVEWEPVERGLADIAGVPRSAIVEMSKRSQDIDRLLPELEAFYGAHARAKGRQVAAYITRAAKEAHGVDPDALRPWWRTQLDIIGFDAHAVERCYERERNPELFAIAARQELFHHLGSAQGVTASSATFDRRDVIQCAADHACDRLDAGAIRELADEWLATEVVVRLDAARAEARSCDVVHLRNGTTVAALPDEPVYTTRAMLALETELFAAYERSQTATAARVPRPVVKAVLASQPELGRDQVAMVRAVCTSGLRFQCVLGPAGSGKTYALAAAARAWADAGYRPIGAAVGGTATEVLRDATGMECSTVASLLARLDNGGALDHRNVVIVDECSTLANRDLAALMSYAERDGAALRLVGDPAQHSAVAAGGAWRALLERYPNDRAELTERRRQAAPEMAEVRMASAEFAAGHIADALERLRREERVVEAATPDELLDRLVADWYVDRQRREVDPTVPATSMVADHHFERRELNRRARALLAANGALTGPVVEVEGQCFQAGDEVIAVEQDRELRPASGGRDDFVRNGERGRVVEARPGPEPVVVVDFARRGLVEVDAAHLTKPVRPGVVGQLAHSYALTSYAAQGETYQAGRHLTTEASTREGVYVGLTRGRADACLYMVARRELAPPADHHTGLPRLERDATLQQDVTRHLQAQQPERLATELDPAATEVDRLVAIHGLAELAARATRGNPTPSMADAAYRRAAQAVAARACVDPEPVLVGRLGMRPPGGPDRADWDAAVGAAAVYRQRWGTEPAPGDQTTVLVLGAPPVGLARADYLAAAEALRAAEASYLSRKAPAELAAERVQVSTALAFNPPARCERELADVERARENLVWADRELERVRARITSPDRSRRRLGKRATRQLQHELAEAEQRKLLAAAARERAKSALKVASKSAPVHDALTARVEVLDAALDLQTAKAVKTRAPYLVAALGERPDSERAAKRWDHAATRIESYRHRQLGLQPEDGPALDSTDALRAALGPRPAEFTASLFWDQTVELAASRTKSRDRGLDHGLGR